MSSSQACDELWAAAVSELVENLDAEQPEDAAAAPRTLGDWAKLYIKYLQALRKLGEAHDAIVHPQKRRALAQMLHACTGRVLEIHAWLVKLNNNVDVLSLEAYLPDMGLTPAALEVPVPTCFREDREQELVARSAAAAALRAAGPPPPTAATDATPGSPGAELSGSGSESESEEEAEEADSQQAAGQAEGPPRTPNVQGMGGEEGPLEGAGASSLTPAQGAVRIQAAVRGWLARRRVAEAWRQELEFLGMLPLDSGRSQELQQRVDAIRGERKSRQAQRRAEYEEGLLGIKAKLKRAEGYGMREEMQGKLNDWFLKSRDPESGAFPDLPDASKGGSKCILRPPPPQPTAEEAAALAAAKEKEEKSKKSGGGKGGKGKGAAAGAGAPKMSRAFLEELHSSVEEYLDLWQDYQQPPDLAVAAVPELADLPRGGGGSAADAFDPEMVRAEVRPVVEEEVRLEVDEDMRRMIANIKEMLKAAKDGRKKGKKGKKGDKKGGKKGGDKKDAKKDVKKGAAGKKDAKGKGKEARGDGEPKKAAKKRKDLTAGRSIESIFSELASNGLVRECPPTTLDDYLGGCNLGQPPPPEPSKAKAAKPGAKKAAAAKPAAAPAKSSNKSKDGKGATPAAAPEAKPYPAASMAQARQAVAVSCILPLGAPQLAAKVEPPRAVLLFGPPASGKSLLSNAVAHQAGATMFDLSPAATDGKYTGKQAALMVHLVFKAARALAPSVVFIDEVEKVFISDKAKAKALAGREPFNRIKKQLLAEVSDLDPGCGVLVLCNSSHPDWCTKKDERALISFFQKQGRLVELPLPDYGSRQALLQAFGERERLHLASCCNLSLVARMTEGYSSGQLEQIAKAVAAKLGPAAVGKEIQSPQQQQQQHCLPGRGGGTPAGTAGSSSGGAAAGGRQQTACSIAGRNQQGWGEQRLSVEDVLEQLLPGMAPVGEEGMKALSEFSAKAHTPLPQEEEPTDKKDGKKKKK